VRVPGWPAALRCGAVGVRPLRLGDGPAWVEVRRRNEDWLAPWEGRAPAQDPVPWAQRHSLASFTALLRLLRREARAGRSLPFAVTVDGDLAGQLTVSGVMRGAYDGGLVGYWVDERVAGRGVLPTALALVVDHCFGPVGLHRLQADVRPENHASLRVMAKLGFRQEGVHERYLFIDEAWRDHLTFALTREEVPGGLLRRLQSGG
jgi:[ribosomal protein S5]-alanine N-acetyltransferase